MNTPSAPSGKSLFIPLKTEFYEAFERGEKAQEYRKYGPGWNEKTCAIGRPVVLSKGYGKGARLGGRVASFERRHGSSFTGAAAESIARVFGSCDVEIACIGITVARPEDFPQFDDEKGGAR